MREVRFAVDSPLEEEGYEPSVPVEDGSFSSPPFERSGPRPSAREEIGPAEKERPFRGAPHRFLRAFDRHQAAGLALIGRSDAEAGGRPRAALL